PKGSGGFGRGLPTFLPSSAPFPGATRLDNVSLTQVEGRVPFPVEGQLHPQELEEGNEEAQSEPISPLGGGSAEVARLEPRLPHVGKQHAVHAEVDVRDLAELMRDERKLEREALGF